MDFYRKGFMIVVVTIFALVLYWMLAPFWGALAWGICLAFLLAGPLVSLGAAFANQVA